MQIVGRAIYRNSFWLVLLFHMLFLFFITTQLVFFPDKEEQKVPYHVPPRQNAISSYVYKGSMTPVMTHETPTPKSLPEKEPEPKKIVQPSPRGIQKSTPPVQKSILAMSQAAIRNDFMQSALSNSKAEEPILLVGDESNTADPLVKLIGKSLSAHFNYPRMEGSFGIRGKVYIQFVLHPEGYYSNIQIVKASEHEDFNRAALYAINSAPRVVGVDKFLPTPKQFLVGFLFE